jgi:hypothetical protein
MNPLAHCASSFGTVDLRSFLLCYYIFYVFIIYYYYYFFFYYHITFQNRGPGWLNELSVGLPNSLYKSITNTTWVRARLCKLQKGLTPLAAASDKVYQLLANGLWFSPGTPASSTINTGRHDIAEILLRVALNTINQIKSNHFKIFE